MYSRQGELDHFRAMKNITTYIYVVISGFRVMLTSPPLIQKKETDKKDIFSTSLLKSSQKIELEFFDMKGKTCPD